MLPPPQEVAKKSNISGASHRYRRYRRADHLGARVPGTNNIPGAMVHNHDAGVEAGRCKPAVTPAVVATVMVKVVGVAALTGRLAGRKQVAPVGTPVQVSEAVIPPIPWPPIERL